MHQYWKTTIDAARSAGKFAQAAIEPLPIRSNELSNAYAVRLDAHDGYPLFGYLHEPKTPGPHVPLFQTPGYGSVVPVPPFERRAAYAVATVCHRGQRHSNSKFQAAYPGLLTHGLEDAPDGYIWRDIAADCVTAVSAFIRSPSVDPTRLAVSGGDLALITAAFVPEVKVLATGGFHFANLERRLANNPDYPLKEFNDFRRMHPDKWDAAEQVLANFDPMALAPQVQATKVLIACGESEKEYAEQLAARFSGDVTIRINTGRGHLDHVYGEEWLAEACGIQPGPAHYPRT